MGDLRWGKRHWELPPRKLALHHPNRVNYYLLGLDLLENHCWKGASQALETACNQQQQPGDAHFWRAWLEFRFGNLAAAELHLDRAADRRTQYTREIQALRKEIYLQRQQQRSIWQRLRAFLKVA